MVVNMQIKKIIKGFVLFSMVVLLAASADSFHSKADEISDIKQSIKDKQNALDQAAKEKKQLQSGLSDVKSIIAGLEQDKKDLSAYINKLDASLSQAQAKILELNPSLVLIDIRMPKMHGIDVIEAARARGFTGKIIISICQIVYIFHMKL